MPTFPTPHPIIATIDVIGDVRITASDREDTTVTVRPGDPSKPADVRAAEQTTVELADGRLLVKTPKTWRRYAPFGGDARVAVVIEIPTGSAVHADSALGNVAAEGELGECQIKTAMGDVRLDQTGPLRASTGYGSVDVDRVDGDAVIKTGSGALRIGMVGGSAAVKNSNGDSTIDEVRGELSVKAANGDVIVGRARSTVTAKTANGDVRIASVERGAVLVETAAGRVEIGIREGTAAWLDVLTRFGAVRSSLDSTGSPGPTDSTVEVRARTSAGDIVISRAEQRSELR
jgi:DUF4097 and DUF4098 domain-containing protein YvlB